MVLGAVLLLVGLVGCLLPLLPGLPLVFGALVIQQLRSEPPFTTRFLIIWALAIAAAFLIEYWLPVYTTKKWGGSRGGSWGAAIGLAVGFLAGPWGVLLGPFVGAFVGEWMTQQDMHRASRAALGSFIGFLAGTVLKLAMGGLAGWYLIRSFLS
jgi:uncharacterized protein YqgC (DUF456 family)